MSKKLITILIALIAITGFFGLKALSNRRAEDAAVLDLGNSVLSDSQKENKSSPQEGITVEKIEVAHFHGAHQCWSCITVGEYALKTIKEKFPEEYENGTIIFKDINGELAENKDIVIKYQARGSSLFINAIKDGVDNIEEDVTVWRLVTNENQYTSYLQNKISSLLGK